MRARHRSSGWLRGCAFSHDRPARSARASRHLAEGVFVQQPLVPLALQHRSSASAAACRAPLHSTGAPIQRDVGHQAVARVHRFPGALEQHRSSAGRQQAPHPIRRTRAAASRAVRGAFPARARCASRRASAWPVRALSAIRIACRWRAPEDCSASMARSARPARVARPQLGAHEPARGGQSGSDSAAQPAVAPSNSCSRWRRRADQPACRPQAAAVGRPGGSARRARTALQQRAQPRTAPGARPAPCAARDRCARARETRQPLQHAPSQKVSTADQHDQEEKAHRQVHPLAAPGTRPCRRSLSAASRTAPPAAPAATRPITISWRRRPRRPQRPGCRPASASARRSRPWSAP